VSTSNYFSENGWRLVETLHTPERQAEFVGVGDLPLAFQARAFLDKTVPDGIYRHQKAALTIALAGKPVCLSTGTASGKSLVFQTAALDQLQRDPNARVMAIYPMKALSNEQRDRWEKVLTAAGSDVVVGRIDGNIPPAMRAGVLERSRVVVFTPDILHAWMFSNLNQPAVLNFLKHTKLVIVDEVHTYSGVFGSNAAFLFRRLQHALTLLGARPGYIAASATIARPIEHLNSLFGIDFELVGPEMDSSPRHALEVVLVEPPAGTSTLDAVVGLLDNLANQTQARFITFVDSRKQVELISSILARIRRETTEEKEAEKPKPKARGRGAKAEVVEPQEEEDPLEAQYGHLLECAALPRRL
jgi:DEAD/DEAH box helicase domain-containing protein